MISEGFYGTEDWKTGDFFITGTSYILKTLILIVMIFLNITVCAVLFF